MLMTNHKIGIICITVAIIMLFIGSFFYITLSTDKVEVFAQFSSLIAFFAILFACSSLANDRNKKDK